MRKRGGDTMGDAALARTAKRLVSATYRRIYEVILAIPRGRVMTYGQVALAAGFPRAARVVGYALRAGVSERPLPWQRVVGKRRAGVAQVSIKDPVGGALQRQLLEKERVVFGKEGSISLARYGHAPAEEARAPRGARKAKRPAR